jgi:hypothetical protein
MTFLVIFRYQWLVAALLFLLSGFFLPDLDISVRDTYYVITGLQAGMAGALLFGIMWALHRSLPVFRTVRWLSHFHLSANSLIGVALLLVLDFPATEPARYPEYGVYDLASQSEIGFNEWIALLCGSFAIVQVIWIVQIVVFFERKRRAWPQ